MEDKKDYSKYAFRVEEKLEAPAMFFDSVYGLLNTIINKDGVGHNLLTEPRFDYVDQETSKVVKKTKKNEHKVRKVFSLEKTLQAQPIQHLTELGKQALALMSTVDQLRVENIDNGKGDLRANIEKEINDKKSQLTAVGDDSEGRVQ